MVEWNMSRSYGWQPRGLKLDIWRILPDDDAQQLTVRSMVLPLGESHASLTDLEPRLEYRITLCPMEGAQSGCKTVLLPSRTAALEGDQPKKAQIDTLKPVSEGSPRPSPAIMVIRIMGCCVVLILTGFTLIVFLTSGTAYPDVVAQIFSEFSIMGAYTCVLMTTTDQRQLTEKQCMVAAVCLQFFFLSTFLFLMLESAYMAKLLVGMFPESLPFNSASVSGAGWGVPAIITGLFAWAFPDKYTRGGQVCWLDLSQVASYSTTVPVGLFVALQLVFLASVFFSARRRRALTCHEFRRARSEASETGGVPPPPAPSRYEPTSSDWDDFDYFCQSPYLLSMPAEAPPRERFKRRLFRRSHRDKYGPDQDRPLQRHQEPQTSASADRVSGEKQH
ncbi:uncharacterized protein ISCGN_018928 [Ixodes scapularis]